MSHISRRHLLGSMLALPALSQNADEWIPLFDGKSLDGWKPSENTASWKVADGALAADGPRSHLFYAGKVRNADFKNFEIKADVMSRKGANGGIFFHTEFQEKGWPAKGFEVQVNNTHIGEGSYRERKKTGSLYAVRNVYKAFAKDDEWFEMHIVVKGKRVEIRLNGMLLVDYVEPDPPVRVDESRGRVLDRGTFALQCHDPGSKTFFRNIRVKPLADDLAGAAETVAVDDVYRELARMSAQNYPVVDYHVHLRGQSIEDTVRDSRRKGIQYGVAVNVGVGFPVTTDAGALSFIRSMQGQPVFIALQGEGREWVKLLSKETIAKFDYVFTDSMTFTDDSGKRMRLWIRNEVGEIPDPERFMETYIDRTLGVLNNEPIDIYVNPTFLPDAIASSYDRLWTPERMQKVIDAAKKNDVALEINNRYRLPSAAFIKLAKAAGVKFAFGTNNGDPNIGRLEYGIEMVKACDLRWSDFFVPMPDGEKPVQKRG